MGITFGKTVEVHRERLYDISCLMHDSNEYIAREANEEDGVSRRFWEGSFKSHALLDESAVLACVAYVNLNPIRANMPSTPEELS
jgi:putative transposase